jgi:putative FmdB family regulatory protein
VEDPVPTYQYACTACGHRFEAVQSFSDASLTDCPECTGRLRKVFSSVGIVFKGSGFYRTDSRSGAVGGSTEGGSGDGASKPDTKSDAPKSESSSKSESGKSDSKPAPSAGSGTSSSPAAAAS